MASDPTASEEVTLPTPTAESQANAPSADALIKHVEELRRQIDEANYNYHVLDNPTISDFEYDMLVRELQSIEQ